jgi:hypothetical protein
MNLARYLQKSIRIEKKILKYTSHQNFIARCIQESVVPKWFQIKWNICLDTTDSDKDRYRDILFRSLFFISVSLFVFISGLFMVLLSASLDCLPMEKTFNTEINGQKCMNRVQNTQNSKIESNRNVFSIGRQSSEADSNTINKPPWKNNSHLQ